MMSKYVPVPCEIYGNYELAILRRAPMRFCWRAHGDLIRMESAIPLNIRSRRQGEFLVMRNRQGNLRVIRLDRIIRTTPMRTRLRQVPRIAS